MKNVYILTRRVHKSMHFLKQAGSPCSVYASVVTVFCLCLFDLHTTDIN